MDRICAWGEETLTSEDGGVVPSMMLLRKIRQRRNLEGRLFRAYLSIPIADCKVDAAVKDLDSTFAQRISKGAVELDRSEIYKKERWIV